MKDDALHQVGAIAKIVVGNLILTATYACITVPNGVINGGVTSFSLILSTITNLDITWFSNGITLFLIAFSFFAIGKGFFLKSLLSSFLYMGLFTLFHATGFSVEMPLLVAAIVGGVLVGVSYFLCIDADSSTAGFDILAIAVHKWLPKTNVAINLRIISILVLVLGMGVRGIEAVLCGIVFTLVETGVLKVGIAWSKRRHGNIEGTCRASEPVVASSAAVEWIEGDSGKRKGE